MEAVLAINFVFPDVPADVSPGGRPFMRADIKFHGVDQAGPSFEVRVFLNHPDAKIDTPLNSENGYAGSFHVYGFGTKQAGTPGPKTPTDYSITATEVVRAAAGKAGKVTVTLVPHFYTDPPTGAEKALSLAGVSVATS